MTTPEQAREIADHLSLRIGEAAFIGPAVAALRDLAEQVEGYEAMKEGVAVRIGDLERENERLRASSGIR